MKEIIRFWFIKRMVKDPSLSAEIYQMIYHRKTFNSQVPTISYAQPKFETPKLEISGKSWVSSPKQNIEDKQKPKISERKRELLEGLKFLQNKTNKTKQDRESIGMLEAALKNVD